MISGLKPKDRRKHEERLVRKHWQRLVAVGLSERSVPFELYFERYKLHAMLRYGVLICVANSLCVGGSDERRDNDGMLIAFLYSRLRAFMADHGTPCEAWKRCHALAQSEAESAVQVR